MKTMLNGCISEVINKIIKKPIFHISPIHKEADLNCCLFMGAGAINYTQTERKNNKIS